MISLLDTWKSDVLATSISALVALCVVAIFISVLLNFLSVQKSPKKEKKSIVETGSMTGFFVVYYMVIRFQVLTLSLPQTVYVLCVVIGLLLLIVGTFTNIWGRIHLGKNWANQVTLYRNQTLVTSGPFKVVRHPLYASLVWMFIGGALIYQNPLSLILTVVLFVPFMVYRARQEEEFLEHTFKEYKKYKLRTGMLFPKVIR